jgi:ribonuclease HII
MRKFLPRISTGRKVFGKLRLLILEGMAKAEQAAAKTKPKKTTVKAKSAISARAQKAKTAKAPAKRGKKATKKATQGRLALRTEVQEWVCSWEFEALASAEGYLRVAGVDEVGRGPLFGPVVAAAVILPSDTALRARLDGLNDSKQLTEEERERFAAIVQEVALAWAVAEVDVETIDRINILQASKLAMKIAVESLHQRGIAPDHLLIDGNQKIDALCRQRTIVQGDARSMSIAAASVLAKVHRDRLLCELDLRYPGYGLASNKGYATPEHREALQRLGTTDLHRRSFAPVAARFEVEVESISLEEAELELDFDRIEE